MPPGPLLRSSTARMSISLDTCSGPTGRAVRPSFSALKPRCLNEAITLQRCVACHLTTIKCGRGVVVCSLDRSQAGCEPPTLDGRESVRGWLRWISRKLQEWLFHSGILRVVVQDRQELVLSPLLHPIP